MKQFWLFSKQTLISVESSQLPSAQLQLRILSFNIRYATTSPFTNEKPWSERFPLIMNQLHHETRYMSGASLNTSHSLSSVIPVPTAAIICLQEVLHSQLTDILHSLNGSTPTGDPMHGPIWAPIGVGRDDGYTKGEYSPIIYPIALFHLLHSETVWLSPTPEKPSIGWDAGSIRILTIAVLECKATGRRVLASCTHLDNAGSESRKHSVEIILRTLKRVEKDWMNDGTLPIFLAGDFNSFPEQEAYLLMSQSEYMYDLREFVQRQRRYNDPITFTGFEPEKDKDEQGRIDFVWLGPKDSKNCSWAVDGYAVLPNVFDDGIYLSDHRCVVGDVCLLC
ncbi:endonuclease/exonuclease/phosphatase [Ophiobolus disseminans]|uniref:Endonuclease/exonuclease/phosphatase n=1 Tax=Ophiobolus disseminans TaxID=1469910 RepID=A0A6A6ZNE1_9PLEO|nr:endonuclease/exonuclease/phosphatase [Ophiobolus disseminans]